MKKQYYLLGAALLGAAAAHAQGTELFFSEYAEGAHQRGVSYNNGVSNSNGSEKALEIYNPTVNTVSLNPYSVRRYSNGSATPTEEEKLIRSNINYMATGANTLNRESTYVLVNSEASLPGLISKADQFSAPYQQSAALTSIIPGGVTFFNGDDAVALVRYPSGQAGTGPGVIIDVIGVIGTQPPPSSTGGTGSWSGTNPLDGTPAVFVSSANRTIIRRGTVSTGSVNQTAASYNIADEWYQYSTAFGGAGGTSNPGGQLYDRFGQHNDYVGPNGVYQTTLSNKLGKFDAGISIYPNPASGTATVELKDVKVGSIVVINNLGQRIAAEPGSAATQQLTLDISGLKAGLYFVQCISADGQTKIYKELVVQ